MGLHANIDGAKKILSGLYSNINGAKKQLSYLYGNINGTSKDVLATKYAWKRYAATSWEMVDGSWHEYYEDTTCLYDSSVTHSVLQGLVSAWDSKTSYSSYSFNSSTGNFAMSGGAEYTIWTDAENGTASVDGVSPEYRWIYPYNSKREICQIAPYGYVFEVLCKTYNSAGTLMSYEMGASGFHVNSYRYAKPVGYSTNYDIVTSPYLWTYPKDGEDYAYSQCGSYHYYGYRYEYIGQI